MIDIDLNKSNHLRQSVNETKKKKNWQKKNSIPIDMENLIYSLLGFQHRVRRKENF